MTLFEKDRFWDFVFILFLVSLCLIVHFLYIAFDGRILIDHDLHYTKAALNLMIDNAPLVDRIDTAYGDNYYLLRWILGVLDWTFGMTPTLYRALPIFFHLMLVLGAYFLARSIGGPTSGFLASLVISSCPVFDNFSRKYFLQNTSFGLFIWAFVILFFMFKGKRSKGLFFLLGLSLSLSILLHYITVLFVPPIFLFLSWFAYQVYCQPDQSQKQEGYKYLVAFFIGLVPVYPAFRNMIIDAMAGGTFLREPLSASRLLRMDEIETRIPILISYFSSLFHWQTLMIFGASLTIAMLFMFIKKRPYRWFFGLTVGFYSFVLYLFLKDNSHSFGFVLPLAILSPITFGECFRFLWEANIDKRLKTAVSILLVILLLSVYFPMNVKPIRNVADRKQTKLPNSIDRRYLFLEKSMGLRVARKLKQMVIGKKVCLDEFRIFANSKTEFTIKPIPKLTDTTALNRLRATAFLNGLVVNRCGKWETAPEKVDLYFYSSSQKNFFQPDHIDRHLNILETLRKQYKDVRWVYESNGNLNFDWFSGNNPLELAVLAAKPVSDNLIE